MTTLLYHEKWELSIGPKDENQENKSAQTGKKKRSIMEEKEGICYDKKKIQRRSKSNAANEKKRP